MTALLPVFVWAIVFFCLMIWVYGHDIIGYFLKLLIRILGEKVPGTKVKIHTQDSNIGGPDWGVAWEADGRKFFFFHDYMGWHNLSEGHHRDKCDDPAYCPWHGSL